MSRGEQHGQRFAPQTVGVIPCDSSFPSDKRFRHGPVKTPKRLASMRGLPQRAEFWRRSPHLASDVSEVWVTE